MPFLHRNGCRVAMTGKLKSFAAHYNDQESPEIIEAVGLDEAEDIALERRDGLK